MWHFCEADFMKSERREKLRCGGGRGVLGAGGCPTECGQLWYQRADQNQGWATGAVSGASPTCEPRMSPWTWDTCSRVVSELGFGPHQCASIGISWSQDRKRNIRAELESWLSKGRWGCPVKSQALGTAAVGRRGGAAGIQPPELRERPGDPRKGESCGVMARGRGGRPRRPHSGHSVPRPALLSPPSWTFHHGHPRRILPEPRPWDRLPTATTRGGPVGDPFPSTQPQVPLRGRTGPPPAGTEEAGGAPKAALQPD